MPIVWKGTGKPVADGDYVAVIKGGEVTQLRALAGASEMVFATTPTPTEPLMGSWQVHFDVDGRREVEVESVSLPEGWNLLFYSGPDPEGNPDQTAIVEAGRYRTKGTMARGADCYNYLYWRDPDGLITPAAGPLHFGIEDAAQPEDPPKPPAEPVKAIATETELREAVKTARDTTLHLARGNFGTLDLDGIKTAGLVIDGGDVALFRGIDANGTQGVTVKRATIQGEGRRFNVNLDHVKDFGLSHLTVVGGWTGVKCFVGENLKYDHIYVDRTEEDCFKFANINGADLSNLSSSGEVHPSATAHPDLIQFQGDSTDVTLRRVLFIARNSERLQLGWFQDGTRHDNLLVEDFLGFSGKLNALHVDMGDNVQIRRVTMLTVPDRGHDQALIVAPSGAVVENCIWTVSRNPGQRGSNLAITLGQYPELFPGALKGLGATLADLEPKGAAIGRGAYDYWRELVA